jgi:glycosyltransferase involved in cell wall biosynthesis
MDKVSICIPVYNGGAFLRPALDSADAQTYPDCEILISDNGSSDGSLAVIEEFRARARTPVRVFTDAPRGMVQNWNHLGFHAAGRWIKYLFQDDLLEPECVATMTGLTVDRQETTLVFSRRHVIVDQEALAVPHVASLVGQLRAMHSSGFPRVTSGAWHLAQRGLLRRTPLNFIGEPSNVMLARWAFLANNGFSLRTRQIVDLEMWLRCLPLGDVVFADEPLSSFRVHEKQMSIANSRADEEARMTEIRVLLETLTTPHIFRLLHPQVRHELRVRVARELTGWGLPAADASEQFWTFLARAAAFKRRAIA